MSEYYSLDMILKSLEKYNFKKEFLKILVFDFLIGNSDRHQNNWAIIQKDKAAELSALYDNGSSLCCYIEEAKIEEYLGNDKFRFQSIVNSKSKSRIRINKKDKREPTHLEVIEYLKNNYYEDVIGFVEKIIHNIDKNSINIILEKYTSDIISEKRKNLIKKFLIEKVKLLSITFNL